MVVEVCIAVATGAFVVITIFLVMALLSLLATLKQTRSFISHVQKDLHSLTEEALPLISHAKETIVDIKKKTDSLDFLFKPLMALTKHTTGKKKDFSGKSAQIIGWANTALKLYKKIKG